MKQFLFSLRGMQSAWHTRLSATVCVSWILIFFHYTRSEKCSALT